ncbi:hypothetical protein MRB53_028216 [Persea americana]|uniref:Uncharacterized protein n=1 Tax=Persea americana TaxID=3435 RepID=A0ACC2KF93_PERAE|nr:hypothetical protein MRB53_028216 [Persea americana]
MGGLKETFELHGKLPAGILQRPESFRTAESSTRKTSQADHAVVEPRLWHYSICTNCEARAQISESAATAAAPEPPAPTPINATSHLFLFEVNLLDPRPSSMAASASSTWHAPPRLMS